MNSFKIGLTGGLASGKSTVAGWLAEAGFHVVDADQLVADLYRPGEPGATAVAETFGSEFLDASGAVDRQVLADRVFHDPAQLARLEEIIHPLVRQAFATGKSAEGVHVLEATRLVEAGYAPDFDLIVTVEADSEIRLQRAIARGLSEDQARARLAAQGDGELRRRAAHRILSNGGRLEDLKVQVDDLVAEVRRRLSSPEDLLRGVTLVTGNPGKAAEAAAICGFTPPHEPVDLPEIQERDLLTVLAAKGEEAWERLRRPVIVEETGLELAALNGFPGPLVKWMLQAIGAEGIAKLAHQAGETRATAHCALLLVDGDRKVFGEGKTHGTLVLPPRGDGGFGWDPIFQPDGEEETYAELSSERKNAIGHRGHAWRALMKALAEDSAKHN